MPQSSSNFSSNYTSNYSPTPRLNVSPVQLSPMPVASPLASMPKFAKNGLNPASLSRLQQLIGLLDSTLRLPNTPRAFAVYLLGLLIIFVGAFLHVLVAAQIMQAEVTLARMEEDFHAIEQQNGDIIFKIARDTNMARLHQRILENGYVPVEEREYVFPPSNHEFMAAINAAQTPATTSESLAVAAPVAPSNDSAANAQAALSSSWGGQVARWEEFLFMTFRSATGRGELPATTTSINSVSTSGTTPGSTTSATTGATSGNLQRSAASPNFWAAWWEQASDQGTKLLDQFRNE